MSNGFAIYPDYAEVKIPHLVIFSRRKEDACLHFPLPGRLL
jgi:hypothetical protein